MDTWVWLMVGAVIASVLMIALCLGRSMAMADRYPHDTGLNVRGWDKRVHEDEDPWWMREYPEQHDPEFMGEYLKGGERG